MAALKAPLPDYLAEAARGIHAINIKSELCKGARTGRETHGPTEVSQRAQGGEEKEEKTQCRTRQALYGDTVGQMWEKAWRQRQLRAAHLSLYRLSRNAAAEAFGGRNEVPYGLWEMRWWAYHQVLRVDSAQQ